MLKLEDVREIHLFEYDNGFANIWKDWKTGEWFYGECGGKGKPITEAQVKEIVAKALENDMMTVYVNYDTFKRSPIEIEELRKHAGKPLKDSRDRLIRQIQQAHKIVVVDTLTYPFCDAKVIYVDSDMEASAIADYLIDYVNEYMRVGIFNWKGESIGAYYPECNMSFLHED